MQGEYPAWEEARGPHGHRGWTPGTGHRAGSGCVSTLRFHRAFGYAPLAGQLSCWWAPAVCPGFLGAGGLLFGRWDEPGGTCRAREIAPSTGSTGHKSVRPRGAPSLWGRQHLCLLTSLPRSFPPRSACRDWDFRCGSAEDRGVLVAQLSPRPIPSDEHTGHTSPGWGQREWLGEAGGHQQGFRPQPGSWGICPLTRPPGFSFPTANPGPWT